MDDEPSIRELLGRILERQGFDVLEADSGEAAIELAARRPVRLVLCDVRMPAMSGPELYRVLSKSDDGGRLRFVFITGDRTSLADSPELGHVPVLTKPFTAADLDAVLDALFPA